MARIAAVGLLAAAAAGGVEANGEDRSGSAEPKLPFKLSYSVQTGEVESNQLTIDPEGVVTASIAHSVPGSPVRAIGRYRLAAGPSDPDLVAIGNVIAENGLAGGRPYTTSTHPGGRYLRFVFEKDGKEIEHVVDATVPLPDALGDLAGRLTPLLARVGLAAPQRAVSIQLDLAPSSAAPGGQMRITLDTRNAGPFGTEIRNFAGFREGGADELRINFWTPPAHAGEPPKFVSTLDLAGKEWRVAEGKSVRPKDPYLKLEGKGSLRAWTDIRVPEADPGALLASLVYYAHVESKAEQSNDDLVVGFYHADPVNVTILPRPPR
jgi:hypothetical protein